MGVNKLHAVDCDEANKVACPAEGAHAINREFLLKLRDNITVGTGCTDIAFGGCLIKDCQSLGTGCD